MQAQYHGLFDGFLFKLSADGSTVLYATYLGTSGWDSVLDLKALDDQTLLVAGYAGFGFRSPPAYSVRSFTAHATHSSAG